jgi:TIR domain
MPYDVFISHSSSDRLVADAVCSRLESAGVRCWIAPRNINPGEGWSAAILRGIEACRLMVLVFSDDANESAHVRREVAHACDHELIVIPMRIRDVKPKGDLQYYLNELHWLDALTPPLERHLETLTARVAHLLSSEHVASDGALVQRNKLASARRHRSQLHPLMALSVAVCVVAVAGASVWMLSTRGAKQSLASRVTEAAAPVTPVLTLQEGVRLVLGEQQTLLNDKELGLRYMPNQGVGTISDNGNQLRLLMAASIDSYLLEGSDIRHLTSARKIFGPGPPGEFDSGAAEVCAVLRSNDRLYAFYQADQYEGLPVIKEVGLTGYYASVGIAESDDNGSTWLKKGQIIKSGKPREWSAYPGHSERGNGLPGAVANPTGDYLFVYYTNLSIEKELFPNICVARCDLRAGAPLPGNWKKFYNGDFSEPGIGGKETSILDVSSIAAASAVYPHVAYSQYLKKYVMVFGINVRQEALEELPASKSGIYLSLSSDGLKWSAPEKLVAQYAIRFLGKPAAIAPSVIFDNPKGQSGWLLYAFSPKVTNGSVPGIPHYMVGQRLDFMKAE